MKGKTWPRWLLFSWLATLLGMNPSAVPAELSGRFSSSIYGFEQGDETHWNPYLGLNSVASLWRQGSHSLGLRTNLRWRGDFSQSELRDPQTYVYDLYFEIAGYPSGSRIFAGRQFVYSSIGGGVIDGIRYKQRISSKLGFDFYGGSTVEHRSPDKVQSFGDDGNLGGRLSYQVSDIRLGLNWLWRRSSGSTAQHRAGLDGFWSLRKADFYGRCIYDIAAMEVSGILARASIRPGSWILTGEFDWRKPSVASNSIFSVVGADAYQSLRADVIRKLPKSLSAVAQLQYELMTGEDSWRTTFGLRSGAIMLGWTHRDGYSGTSDGLTGNATVRVNRYVEAYASAYLAQYKIQPETVDWIDDYSSSMGLVWRPTADLRLRAEGQYLRNAVKSSDWRVFLQITKGFSLGSGSAEDGR